MPELNTSSLPDLIFSILFFFMIVTSMREEEVKVEFKAPKGTELNKLEKKTAGINLYIGERKAGANADGKTVVQINDASIELEEIFMVRQHVAQSINSMKEDDKQHMRVVLKVDAGDDNTGRLGANMTVVNAVKKELQEVNALRIMYSADRKAGEE